MGTISVDLEQYVSLLIRANCTDPEQWPEGLRQGAGYLARVREIEQECKSTHGKWDWEFLSEELQDEYDSVCSQLDTLRNVLDPQPTRPFREWLKERDLSPK